MKNYESLEERLYKNEMQSIESSNTPSLIKKSKTLCAITAVGAISLGAYTIYTIMHDSYAGLTKSDFTGIDVVVTLAALSLHFHSVKKIESYIERAKKKEKISEKEINSIKKTGKIGRYSHALGATTLAGATIAALSPISLIFLPIFAAWGYSTIYKAYGAFYSAITDYAMGKDSVKTL